MRLTTRVCTTATLATAFAAVSTAQPWSSGKLSVRPTSILADSLVNFTAWPNLQAARLTDGRVLVGPMPGNTIVSTFSSNLTSSSVFMRAGSGPREANQPFLIVSAADDGRSLVASLDPLRVTLFNRAGDIEIETASIQHPDGIGYCGGALYTSGTQQFGANAAPGIYKLSRAAQPEIVFPLREGTAERPAKNLVQLMHAEHGRILVGRPNSNSVTISRRACGDFSDVPVKLPWFIPWEKDLHIRQDEGPVQSLVRSVRWLDDSTGMLLIFRARPGSKYAARNSNATLPPPRRTPSDTPPTDSEIHIETVLVVFDVLSGSVRDQLILPRTGWSFLSNHELIRHNFDPNKEWYEVFAIKRTSK